MSRSRVPGRTGTGRGASDGPGAAPIGVVVRTPNRDSTGLLTALQVGPGHRPKPL